MLCVVQPGHGSRYIRHKDTFFNADGIPTNASSSSTALTYRKLTCIYYLNDSFEGGHLRVFLPNSSSYIDIEPKLGTLILFRR